MSLYVALPIDRLIFLFDFPLAIHIKHVSFFSTVSGCFSLVMVG